MKPKRIKATNYEAFLDGSKPVKCYLIRRSDVWAAAEQIAKKMSAWNAITGGRKNVYVGDVLEGLKAVGMTPGRKERAK